MSANPFDEDHHATDPFSDPVIASALATSALQPDALVDSDEDDYGKPALSKSSSSANPYRIGGSRAIPVPTEDPLNQQNGSALGSHGNLGDANLTDRERELRRREQELLERERRLQQEQENIRLAGASIRPPNFPPLYPFMYHDIDVEIPQESRKTVRFLFYTWLAVVASLLWNAVACFLILVSHATGVTTGGADFGAAFVYCFTITAGSFFLWYRPIYNAYMKERSLYYCMFLNMCLLNVTLIVLCRYLFLV